MRIVISGGVLLALALAGCDIIDPKDCSVRGCFSGVQVEFAEPPGQSYTVELLVERGGALVSIAARDCTQGALCRDFVVFESAPLEGSVRVRVTTAAGTATSAPQPLAYERSQPNGPDCPPVCYLATVLATLPAEPARAGGAGYE